MSAILAPPFRKMEIRFQICDQRPQKPWSTNFHENFWVSKTGCQTYWKSAILRRVWLFEIYGNSSFARVSSKRLWILYLFKFISSLNSFSTLLVIRLVFFKRLEQFAEIVKLSDPYLFFIYVSGFDSRLLKIDVIKRLKGGKQKQERSSVP